MKRMFCLFAFATVQLFAVEENSLKDACGYVYLSSEQIEALDSWGESKKISIGSGSLMSAKGSGLMVQAPVSKGTEHLADISFENEEFSTPQKVIAEREVKSLGARNQ